MTEETSEDISWRNLLRLRILEVADDLEGRKITAAEGARALRDLSDADVKDMDEADIEIDFDAGDISAGGLLALEAGQGAPSSVTTDPVEAALTRVFRLRDRNNSLKIVAETPGDEDRKAYQQCLEDLREALNGARIPHQDRI